MQLLSYQIGDQISFGAKTDAGIIDLAPRLPGIDNLRALLEQDRLADVNALLQHTAADLDPETIDYLPTLPNAQKYLCIGVNYGKRNAEYRDQTEQPNYPSLFMRTRESFVGHDQPILRPPESLQLDYEGEIAIVIGKAGRRIPQSKAMEHIAGLTLMNEGSIRDWLRHAKFNVTQGKNFERSGALGPCLVTADEFSSYTDLRLQTRVNNELRQDDTTANLMFPFEYLISYLSTFMRLQPGDVISTGTPIGAGARFDPPQYLTPGDRVEITVPGIGTLSNPIDDEEI